MSAHSPTLPAKTSIPNAIPATLLSSRADWIAGDPRLLADWERTDVTLRGLHEYEIMDDISCAEL